MPPIDCYFNDIDTSKIEKLKNIVAERQLYSADFGEMEFTSQDYKEKIKDIYNVISKLKKQKAFVFIDPYGYKNIKVNDIKNLLSSGNVEVLLFLPIQFMYRFSDRGIPEALLDFIKDLVGDESCRKAKSVWNFLDQLKKSFREYIGNKYFVDTFTIKKDRNTVFCLFFFTSHIDGLEKMLEVKWELDEQQGQGWDYNNTYNLFPNSFKNTLEEKIISFLKERKVYNGDLYGFTLQHGFLPKHTYEILCNLQKTGKLEVKTDKGEKVRKSSFYISYQNYRDHFKKVFFKLD
ncbi:MAG: hypothetical protein C0412_21325 [Flavobacterium sp.]|nr:hypothetical protein [Flavobacterium sp.]